MSEITRHLSPSGWPASPCIIFPGSMCVAANGKMSFLSTAEWYSTIYIHRIFSIHSLVDGHLSCLHNPTTVDTVAINLRMHGSPWISIFARTWSSFIFKFLRKLCTILQGGCSDLHSHQQCKRLPLSTSSPTPAASCNLTLLFFAILTSVRLNYSLLKGKEELLWDP